MTELDDAMKEHMVFIVHIEHRPFCYKDFINFKVDGKLNRMSHGTFRNKISMMIQDGKVEVYTKSNPFFYTLKGCRFGNGLMTDNHTEVINYYNDDIYKSLRKHPIYAIIKNTPFGKRSIHDIHLTFESKGLWNFLTTIAYYKQRINSDNQGISFGYYRIEKYLAIRVRVQDTDTVNVIVKCSSNPIILNFDGVMRLTEALTRVEERLSAVLNDPGNKTFNAEYNPSEIKIPNKDDWKIVLWHFNRDSLVEYSEEKFHCTWHLAKNLFLRIYSKELSNRNIIRVEIQENPDIQFKNLLVDFIRNDNYQRLIELLV